MKKVILLTLIALTLFTKTFATSRNSTDALVLANSFYQKNQKSGVKLMSIENSVLKLAYSCTDGTATRSATGNVYYYVFNAGSNNGFIIISGDDRAKDVLGYSDNGTFDINSLPSGFSYWLSFYKNEMQYLMSQQESASASSTSVLSTVATRSVYASSVSPLLGNIKWNQSSPYNNLCPLVNTTTRAATGCLATAMSQLMRYYKYPSKGIGSNTYTTPNLNKQLSVDFSATTYDWDNMTETYGSWSTAVQQNAVATLLYHAGVAVNMNYGTSSSASTINMALALINNFNYDPNLQLYSRDFYTISEWTDMIKTELNARRPVLYSGQSSSGGHEFVCDGYDSNGLFHFNWGWGGMSDGYFELSALNPGALGIGGGNGGGFNFLQDIVTGVQKPCASVTAPYQLYLDTPLSPSSSIVSRASSFNISMTFWNKGVNSFAGSIGLALYNSNNEFVSLVKSSVASPITSFKGYINPNYTQNISISSDVATGTYKLYSVYKLSGQSNWQIMRGRIGTPNYLNVKVSASDVTFSSPDVLPRLTLNSMTCTGNVYNNTTGRFTLNITNSGAEYNSNIVLKLISSTNSSITQTVCTDPVTIAAGETKNIEFSGKIYMLEGQYTLTAYYDPDNNRSVSNIPYLSFSNPVAVSIQAMPSTKPVLSVTSKISFPDATKVSASDAILTAKIKNTGGYFSALSRVFIYPPEGGNLLMYFGDQQIILDTNEEQTVVFRGNIALTPDFYTASIYYWDAGASKWTQFPSSNNYLKFTLVSDATGIEQTRLSKPVIYPNPATDVLYLQSEEKVTFVHIFDISGHQLYMSKPMTAGEIVIPVSELSSGVYILRSETESGVKINKFIKK